MMINRTSDISKVMVEGRSLHSATHEDILGGLTTDVYFVRTRDILDRLGLLDTPVTADVFARRQGVFCGCHEVAALLDGRECDIETLEEGEEFQAFEPVMRIRGKYSAFGMFETVLLGMLAAPSGWATAARECKKAAGGCSVVCFGARHVHPAVAPVMERAAMIGGADGCSCILGAALAGVNPTGTIPHAAILIAGDTLTVAKTFDEIFPADVPRIILVDTFRDEAEESLHIAESLGSKLAGIRLDTPAERGGVTAGLVREVRARLDLAGAGHVKIAVSGGIDPVRIAELKSAGAELFGAGSFISSAPPIDMTLDIKEINGTAIAKRGRIPGPAPTARLKKRNRG